MPKYIRATTIVLLSLSLLVLTPLSHADWKDTLSNLWEETKTKTIKPGGLFNPKEPVSIGIAYGTEKKAWLQWAVEQFAKTEQGKKIKIELIPMGSIEGAKAVLDQDRRIHVWSPASSLVQDLLVEPWMKEHQKDPIISDAPLVLTPMVIVMWADRYEAFMAKYQAVDFKTIAQALSEQTGWTAIAGKPEWGLFTFGHTMPTHSNSGLLALVLMAYDYANVSRGLKAKHIMDEEFLTWQATTQENMSADETSTGKLMTKMLRFGPSELNGVIVYENLVLSNLETAKGRWGEIKIVYPTRSVWNDNPYYILNVPWSTSEHQEAAKIFQDFLLSQKAQREARDKYLFRPASLEVPILEEESAFAQLKESVQVDVATIKRPRAEVLNQLIQIWTRNH